MNGSTILAFELGPEKLFHVGDKLSSEFLARLRHSTICDFQLSHQEEDFTNLDHAGNPKDEYQVETNLLPLLLVP